MGKFYSHIAALLQRTVSVSTQHTSVNSALLTGLSCKLFLYDYLQNVTKQEIEAVAEFSNIIFNF